MVKDDLNKETGSFSSQKEDDEEENNNDSFLLQGYLSDENNGNIKNIRRNTNSVGISDFEFIKLISKGAFGRVWLVKRILTGDIYAMKIINFAEKVFINLV